MTRRGPWSSFRCGEQSPWSSLIVGHVGMRGGVIVARAVQPMGFQMVDPHAVQELAELFSDLGKDLLSERGLDSTLGPVLPRLMDRQTGV